jgi:hypothetical protein
MNKFLNRSTTIMEFDITITASIRKEKAVLYKESLETIVKNTSEEDIILLGKLCKNNVLRNMALAKLRDYV